MDITPDVWGFFVSMNNYKSINIRITQELKDKLKVAAKEAGMPVSVFLRIVLSRIVKQP